MNFITILPIKTDKNIQKKRYLLLIISRTEICWVNRPVDPTKTLSCIKYNTSLMVLYLWVVFNIDFLGWLNNLWIRFIFYLVFYSFCIQLGDIIGDIIIEDPALASRVSLLNTTIIYYKLLFYFVFKEVTQLKW